jgi:GH15 family glucan-1,4-alpha-glucosidase
VRTGNGAARQHQLDGYGWVLDAAWLLTDAGHRLYGETWRVVAGLADRVATTWTDPDAGIWERRTAPAHHVHSKLMAWLALDRAIRIATARGDRGRRRQRRWTRARDDLAVEIQTRGFDHAQGAYTGAYASTELDAAVLLPVLEFQSPRDPRVVSTIDAIRHRLGAGEPLLYRYRPGADGLAGGEAPSCLVRSGWCKPSPEPAASPKPRRCSTPCSRWAAPWACTPRRLIPSTASISATSPRR